jgi:hypothetical protein
MSFQTNLYSPKEITLLRRRKKIKSFNTASSPPYSMQETNPFKQRRKKCIHDSTFNFIILQIRPWKIQVMMIFIVIW